MPTIKFSTNWNNKLNCTAFTTLRLRNDSKYVLGEYYTVELKEERFEAQIRGLRHFYLGELNEFVAFLDTGYSLQECKGILEKMYGRVDFTKKQLTLILLVRKKD